MVMQGLRAFRSSGFFPIGTACFGPKRQDLKLPWPVFIAECLAKEVKGEDACNRDTRYGQPVTDPEGYRVLL